MPRKYRLHLSRLALQQELPHPLEFDLLTPFAYLIDFKL
jgi:hypothetical protein